MHFKSKTIPLFVLGIVSLTLSRITFAFINDPEGPNLVVVVGLAAIIFGLFSGIYFLLFGRAK